jgi:hypothetical protein
MSQDLPADSPEAVVDAIFVALEAKQYEAVARYIEPQSLAQFHGNVLAAAAETPRPLTVEDLKRHDPDLPDAVAEYQVQQFALRAADAGSWLLRDYAGIETREQLQALSPEQLLGRWLAGQAPEHQLRQTIRENRHPVTESDLVPVLPQIRRQVLGAVREDESVAHVVYRFIWQIGNEEEADIDVKVTTLRRTPVGWRMIWRHDFLNVGNLSFDYSQEEPEDAGPEAP